MTQPNSIVRAGNVEIGNSLKLSIIAGPCQLESRAHAFDMAGALKETCQKLGVGLIYKTSFDKANRSSAATQRGMGLENALPIFSDIRKHFDLRPYGIIQMLDLIHPMYQQTASYGHFGRTPQTVKGADGKSYTTFSWEKTDKAELLRADAKLK